MKVFGSDGDGQSALIDAMLFFFIMIIGSVFLNVSFVQNVERTVLLRDDANYCRDTLDTLLECTIQRTNYTKNNDGEFVNVELINRNVFQLITEDLLLRDNISRVDENSLVMGIERPIEYVLDNLTSYTFGNGSRIRIFHYSIQCSLGNTILEISDIGPDEYFKNSLNIFTAQQKSHSLIVEEEIDFLLHLWRV